MAILAALVGFFYLIRGFTNRQLVERVAALLDSPYTNRQATYDLRRLKRKGLIEKIAGTQRFQLTRLGRRVAMLFTKTYGRVLAPGLSVLDPRLQMTYRRVALSAQLDAALRKRSTILWKRNWSRVKLDRFVNFSGYQVYLVRRNQIPHLYSDSEGELADGGGALPEAAGKVSVFKRIVQVEVRINREDSRLPPAHCCWRELAGHQDGRERRGYRDPVPRGETHLRSSAFPGAKT